MVAAVVAEAGVGGRGGGRKDWVSFFASLVFVDGQIERQRRKEKVAISIEPRCRITRR